MFDKHHFYYPNTVFVEGNCIRKKAYLSQVYFHPINAANDFIYDMWLESDTKFFLVLSGIWMKLKYSRFEY